MRSNIGIFTILEVFVLIIIVALLVGVALPYFFSAEDAQIEATVRANMKIAQMAAESYALDNGGIYPSCANDAGYRSYFQNGNRSIQSPNGGNYPINPFTKRVEPPFEGDVVDVEVTRHNAPTKFGRPGAIYYSPIITKQDDDSDKPTSYAIQGAGRTGYALVDHETASGQPRLTYVLTKEAFP